MRDLAIAGQMVAVLLAVLLAALGGLPEGRRRRSAILASIGGLGLAFVLSLYLSSPPQFFWDFLQAYDPAGRAALQHDPAGLKALIGAGVGGGFVNIPAVAYLFAPFALLPAKIAALLFSAIGLGLTITAWFLLTRLAGLEGRQKILLAVLFLLNGPLLSGFKWGNISYFILLPLAAGLMLLRARRSLAAGLLLGLAAVLKPAFALFFLFFVLRRDWRGALGFAGIGLAVGLVSLGLYGWPLNLYWLQTSILQYSHTWLAASGNQSVAAFLFRLHAAPSILLDFAAKMPSAGERFAAQLATLALFLLAALACWRGPQQARKPALPATAAEQRRDLQYLLTLCLCLVGSPLSWTHYYAWLLVPAAFFLAGQPWPLAAGGARLWGWAAIALTTPLFLWPQPLGNSPLAVFYASFLVSHHLLGGLIWFGLIAWSLARMGGLLAAERRPLRRLRPDAVLRQEAQDGGQEMRRPLG